MVKLANIGRSANAIWCDYYPEGKEVHGHIKVDMNNEEIIQLDAAPNENNNSTSMYAHHAMMRLIELKNVEKLPNYTSAIWY